VSRIKQQIQEAYGDNAQKVLRDLIQPAGNGKPLTPTDWAHSSVSTFGVRYAPPLPDLPTRFGIEALVEGSEMSTIREGVCQFSEKYRRHYNFVLQGGC
jgi:hypothetical protein